MATMFAFGFLASVLGLLIGLLRPQLGLPRSTSPSRKKVVAWYGAAALICLMAIGSTVEPSESRSAAASADSTDTTAPTPIAEPASQPVEARSDSTYRMDSATPAFIDPNDLELRRTYVLADSTPLMPEFEPTDPMTAIAKVRYLDAGRHITILESRTTSGAPWYRVRLADGTEGWVNSVALFGQKLIIAPR